MVIETLIRQESDGTLSFGNYKLNEKAKLSDFEYEGDLYKIKTFYEITKLERNGLFVYESVPGTAVSHMVMADKEVSFEVEGEKDAQITLELEPEKGYKIYINGAETGEMKTNLGGKLVFSVASAPETPAKVKVVKL